MLAQRTWREQPSRSVPDERVQGSKVDFDSEREAMAENDHSFGKDIPSLASSAHVC